MACSCGKLFVFCLFASLCICLHGKSIFTEEATCKRAHDKLWELKKRFANNIRDALFENADNLFNDNNNEASGHSISALNKTSNEFPPQTLITPDMLQVYLNTFTALYETLKISESKISASEQLKKFVDCLATERKHIIATIEECSKCSKYQERHDLQKLLPLTSNIVRNFRQLRRHIKKDIRKQSYLKHELKRTSITHKQLIIEKIIQITISDVRHVTMSFLNELDIKLLNL